MPVPLLAKLGRQQIHYNIDSRLFTEPLVVSQSVPHIEGSNRMNSFAIKSMGLF
jgi:hypothetical protein